MDVANSNTDKKMIICELLCYLRAKVSKLSSVTLKNVINDFYSSESVSEAKEILVSSVDGLNLDKWPKPARRKQTDNKTRMEVDDIFCVFNYLDENLLMDKLPTYVALNIDNIPSSKIEEGDMRCVLNKLDNVEKKVEELGRIYVKPNFTKSNTSHRAATNLPVTGTDIHGHTDTNNASSSSWADVLSMPQNRNESGHATGGTDADTDTQPEMDLDYSLVTSRKRRHQGTSGLNRNVDSRVSQVRKSKVIIGSNTSCALKAAKELKKNRVFASAMYLRRQLTPT